MFEVIAVSLGFGSSFVMYTSVEETGMPDWLSITLAIIMAIPSALLLLDKLIALCQALWHWVKAKKTVDTKDDVAAEKEVGDAVKGIVNTASKVASAVKKNDTKDEDSEDLANVKKD